MLAAHLTARLTASRTYQPSRPSETTYGDCLAACSWAWKAWRTITRPSAQRSVANPAFCVVTSPINGQTVPSGHGRSAGSVRDRLAGPRPQAPGPGALDRPDGPDSPGGSHPAGSRRLGRQRGRVGDAAVDPAAQVVLGMAVGGDQQPALHRPDGQVEGPDARLTLDRLDGVGGQPHDQVVAPPPASHVVVHEEGEATERLLLGQPRPVADRLPDPGGEALVVRHRTIPSVADPTGWVEG